MKGLRAKQADYVYRKCKNYCIIGTKQVYECEWNNEEKADSKLYSHECSMLNDFKLYNSILSRLKKKSGLF